MNDSSTAHSRRNDGVVRSGGTMRQRGSRSVVLAAGLVAAFIAAAASAAAPQTRGTLQFFTDEAAFDAALGVPTNLVLETFDGGAPVGPFPTLCNEPMSTDSNDVCFTPGQLIPGFAITSTSGSGIIEFPPAFLGAGQTTRAVGATNFADFTIVSFDPVVGAAAADVYGGLSTLPVDVEVFDDSGNSLGTTTVQPGATRDVAEFFGVISPTPIGKITFNSQDNGGELIDNLQFRGAGLQPPGVVKSFAPGSVAAGSPSTLTITLGNQGQPGAATLSADLTDSLPAGLVVADTPNASTTCTNGTLTANAGSGDVTLGMGAGIPGAGTCTITVDVTGATPGVYANTIAAGALITDLGSNADPANATLVVLSNSPDLFPPAEDFDETPPPALPDGWTSSTTTGGNDWITTTDVVDSAPNSAHAPEMATVNDFTMDTPEFTPVAGQNVTFRQRFNLERRYDGAVLEISIDGGAFADILDAGGSFVTGGYSYAIHDSTGNPIGGRLAWTGDSNGFLTTIATLPAAAVGHPTRLRFRTADDATFTADGDTGWWIDSIVLGVNPQPPIASIAPASLNFSVDPDATASDTLTLSNTNGSDPLTYTVESRSATRKPTLIPYATLLKKAEPVARKTLVPRPLSSIAAHDFGGSLRAPSVPWVPDGGLSFVWDDGSAETALGAGSAGPPATEQAAVYINRFVASDALVIHSVSVFWPVGDGDLSGLQANLVVYYDADGDGDPTNAVRVGADMLVPISVTGNFQTYQTDFSIPAGGDVYIGFVDQWALDGTFTPRLFPAALDESPSNGMSYISSSSVPPVDTVNLGNNDITGTIFDVEQGSLDGNFMIRATATGGGGGGACTGPIVSWLSATPSSGSVDGGADTTLTITVDPAAGGLVPGVYNANVCISTNDPSRNLIAVPVTVTVGTPPPVPCSSGDEIFCNGFEPAAGSGSIVSGTVDQAVVENGDGSSFDFATGSYHGYDPSITADDINLYELIGGPDGDGMYVYWYGDLVPPAYTNLVGGVVDAGGVDFAVLHSGDTVGPSSAVSGASTLMTNWLGSTDGYIGIAFYNESTGAVNYGYLHLTTTGPEGFPAEALDWAYDDSGAAITIP